MHLEKIKKRDKYRSVNYTAIQAQNRKIEGQNPKKTDLQDPPVKKTREVEPVFFRKRKRFLLHMRHDTRDITVG